MPLVASAVLAYAAGLLAGFAGLPASALAIAGALILVAAWRRSAVIAGIAIAFGGGALMAAGHAVGAERCARPLPRQTTWLVKTAAPAEPGAFVAGRSLPCGGAVSLGVERGRAEAGATVRASGTPVVTSRGLLVQHATIRVVSEPDALARWRTRAGASIDAFFGPDAPIARALLIADMRQLSPEVRDRYAAAGLAHMLSISGLHVGIIAYALALMLQICRLPRRAVTIATVATIAIYVAAIGAPPPAVRSAVMLAMLELSRLMQRPTSPWAILAAGAVGPVADPETVLDLGYQLSVVGVAALIAASRLARVILPRELRGWRRDLLHGALASTLATIVSAPLVAWTFGRVSIIGPLTNLAAAPLMGMAQPMLFAALVLSPLAGVARWIADAAHPLLVGFDTIASWGAALPFARVEVAPTVTAAVLGGTFSASVVAACVSRYPRSAVVAAGFALCVLAWLPVIPSATGMVELHMLDVGEGDALALRTSHGKWILFDAGRSVVVPYVARRGGDVEVMVLSHPHSDHAGGAASVIHALRPKLFVDPGFVAPDTAYRASLAAARDEHVRWKRVAPRDSLVIDGVTITLLAPDSAWASDKHDANLANTIALVRVGDVRFLLTGDAEREEEEWVVANEADLLRADVLKVAHHGSRSSSTDAFLDAVQPRLALVSVGAGNSYGHPGAEIMTGLAHRGAQVLRTDLLGTVVVRTDGAHIFVEARGETWQLSPYSIP